MLTDSASSRTGSRRAQSKLRLGGAANLNSPIAAR